MVDPANIPMWDGGTNIYVQPNTILVVDQGTATFSLKRRFVVREIREMGRDGSYNCRVSPVKQNGWIGDVTMTTLKFENCELKPAHVVCQLNQRAAWR